jgi:serpin B
MDAMGIQTISHLRNVIRQYASNLQALGEMNTNNCQLASNMFVLSAEGIKITEDCEDLLPSFNGVNGLLESVEQVNGLVSYYTEGKITDIIDSISGVESIILNILYFKGEWESEFESAGFMPFGIENKHVPMMTRTFNERIPYASNDHFQYAELSYKNGLKAGIFLPNKGVNIQRLLVNIEEIYQRLDNELGNEKVELTMPKFKVESNFELKDVLINKFGIKDAFTGRADFSNLYENAGGIHISKIIHKTFISVDEKGTEAAAVTAVIMERGMSYPKNMVVDRPFIFTVFDSENKINIFTAVVEDI